MTIPAPARSRSLSPTRVPGTAAVVLLLGGSKWAAYLGWNPFFLTDLIIGSAVLGYGIDKVTRGWPRSMARSYLTKPLVMLASLATVRLLWGPQYDFNSLRDFAPYAYAFIGILSAAALARVEASRRQQIVRLLWMALKFHLAWVFLSKFAAPVLPVLLVPGSGVRFLSIRTDVDSALLGVTAAFALLRWVRDDRQTNLLIFLGSILAVGALTSRAGLIATTFCLLCSMTQAYRTSTLDSRRKLALVGIAPVALGIFLLVLPHTTAGARLGGTFGITQQEAGVKELASARGTTDARRDAWTSVIRFAQADLSRNLFGVGFGPDFMSESGATSELLGREAQDDVRSPHNYFIGTYARMGLLGLLAALAVALTALIGIGRTVWSPDCDELGLLASLIALAILIIASLGVVLEAPFGAVPFFWALGALASLPPSNREHVDLKKSRMSAA